MLLLWLPATTSAQGETTSAIVGQVSDATGAAVPHADVTVVNKDTGLRRNGKTDNEGYFNFPQLKPGMYSVKVEAEGFEWQQNDAVTAALGQKQTVNFTLKVAQSKQTVEIRSDAPILNPENANTSTTLSAPALENLPNPGGDLTYPLQFAAGALINTAGSGNDFVGGTNGYGNVEFNGLPALSNGYIVDGLETNDPLTNLNSGLSTNLVLGLNSISEVTVNTLSYAVDQGRYGASQVNYVTKSGSNEFHGNLYELWNGSRFNAANYFTNATPGNHKPRSTVNHFGGSVGGPIIHDKLFFFFDSEWVRIALPIVTAATVPTSAFQELRPAAASARRHRFRHRLDLSAVAAIGAVLSENVLALPQHERYASRRSWLPIRFRRWRARDFQRRKRLRQSSKRLSFERRSRAGPDRPRRLQHQRKEHHVVSLPDRQRAPSCIHRSDQSSLQRNFSAAALFLRRRLHARLFAKPRQLFQSRLLLVSAASSAPAISTRRSPHFPSSSKDSAPMRRSPPSAVSTTPGSKAAAPRAFSSTTISPGATARTNSASAPIRAFFASMILTSAKAPFPPSPTPRCRNSSMASPQRLTKTFPTSPNEPFNFLNLDLYAQDTWKVTETLTWTFGLRDTLNSNPLNPHQHIARLLGSFDSISHDVNQPLNAAIQTGLGNIFSSTPLAILQPRTAIAWQFDPKSVLRAGFGIFSDILPGSVADVVGVNPPYVKSFQGGLLGTVGGTADRTGRSQ